MVSDYYDFLRDLTIDLVAIWIYAFAIYYRRYCDRQMAITLSLFNIFLFTVVITMTLTEFDLAAGFALFAMLSIISLRSVNISKIEVAYLFGAITLGLINGISFADYILLMICNLVIISGVWILDSKWFIKRTVTTTVTLDNISALDLKDENQLKARVQDLHKLPVKHLSIEKFNGKKNTVQLMVRLQI